MHVHTDLRPRAAMTLSSDRAAHRAWLVDLTGELRTGIIADIGCGRGEDLSLLATRHRAADVRLIGVDGSAAAVAAASTALSSEPRASVQCADLSEHLPFDDSSIDILYSHNVLECWPDAATFVSEAVRVLRPGGRLVVGHWDWDSQMFDGSDKALVRRLVHTFADRQQAWMAHADGWMGRRLWGVFSGSGLFDGTVHSRVLTNTTYEPGHFGYENAQAFAGLARRGLITNEDYERFAEEQVALAASGRYFYSIAGFAYVGVTRVA